MNLIAGFSKLPKEEKVDLIVERFFHSSLDVKEQIKEFWHTNSEKQKIFDEFSENTLTNFFSPYGVVPNVKINGELFCVPMVTEESSVVAAACKSAKFWFHRGGIKTEVRGVEKIGHVHFSYKGQKEELFKLFQERREELLDSTKSLSLNMRKRGGGPLSLDILDKRQFEPNYYQLCATFDTCDAMGANFINSILEVLGKKLASMDNNIQIIMCILSNYNPNCLAYAQVSCPIDNLVDPSHTMNGADFARKFIKAVNIANADIHRAVTHNKGIFNGIDAVVLATGNDFRAVEACGHAYASRDGQYRSLSRCRLDNHLFTFSLEIPLALGTVGGLTKLHPMAEFSLKLLKSPTAPKLMEITAAVGLIQNFAALKSLITSGIQKGHMKMHLLNILNQLEANEEEKEIIKKLFSHRSVSFRGVKEEIEKIRHSH